jgi:hypothetical protein
MRKTWTAALFLFPALAIAQAAPSLPEGAYADLEKKLAPLAQKYGGVTFSFPRKSMTGGWANVNYVPANNQANAEAYVAMFLEEFAKYPADFIQKSRLRRVEFVEKLAVGSQYRSAVPNYEHEVLYYDVSYVANQRYVRHVVHHEFYHMLEQEWNGDSYYRDPNWAQLNEKGFAYGAGGENAYGRGDVWSFVHPKPGFVNLYSTYGLEEDKAEVWAVLFVPENWKIVRTYLEGDPILRAKVSYMREFGRSKSQSMDDKFWRAVSGDVP